MKEFARPLKVFLALMLAVWILCVVWRNVYADPDGYYPATVTEETVKKLIEESKKADEPKTVTKGFDKRLAPQCPKTLLQDTDTCMRCHTFPSWKIKEAPIDEGLDYPNARLKIRGDIAYYEIQSVIDGSEVSFLERTLDYLHNQHPEVKTMKIDILSGGGSMFDGWQVVSLLERKKGDLKIQTEVQGFAASAAFLIFLAGDERATYSHAILMWHEVWTFRMFSFDTVSSSEEKARMMRFFQDNAHTFILSKCDPNKLDKKKLNDLVAGEKQFWMNGCEALEYGFATKLL